MLPRDGSPPHHKINQQAAHSETQARRHTPPAEGEARTQELTGRELILPLGAGSDSSHSSSGSSIDQSEALLKTISPDDEGDENENSPEASSSFIKHLSHQQLEQDQQLHEDHQKQQPYNYFPTSATNPPIITSSEQPSAINSSPATTISLSTTTILQPNTPSGCSSSKDPSIYLAPPKIIGPNNLEPQATTTHKKRRVQWVGLKERDSIEIDDWPSSSSHQSHQPHASQASCHHQPENTTDLSPSLSDHIHHIHQRHHHNRLGPNSSSKSLLSRPFSIRLPDRPTVEQFSQQIAAQRSRSTSYHQSHQDAELRENSISSLALSTHQNTRANSTSCATFTNTTNPYFPSILPHPTPLHPNHHQVHPTPFRRNSIHRRGNFSHSLNHSPSDSRDGHLAPPMATPDHSRPATPDSDLDIPFGERDGLPSNPNRKPRTFTREAANLVSLHKYNISSARSRNYPHTAGKKLGTAASHNATVRENRALGASQGVPSTSAGTSRSGFMGAGLSVGNGVLSSLLHLYSHPASAQSSSATFINYGSEDDSDGVGEGSQSGSSHVRHSSQDGNHARLNEAPTQPQQFESLADENKSQSGVSTLRNSTDGTFKPKKRIFETFSKVARRFDHERPVGARSKAGVFGALQASAMGLGGVAAPAATNIAPAVEKSGYRLARYTPSTSQSPETGLPMTPALNFTSDDPYGEMTQVPIMDNDSLANRLRRTTSAGVLVGEASEEDRIGMHDPSLLNGRSLPGNVAPGRLASSASSSAGSIFKSRIHKSSSMVSLKALGEAIKPTKFHNESAILKAKKASTSPPSGSTPGTPAREFPFMEKTPTATPIGLPPHLFNHPNHIPSKAHQHNYIARRRREKRRQDEIFITMHVAAILQRQQFILQLTRALMMFGGPSHRLESQILATARVLEIDLQVVLIYSVCIFSFQDEATHTSETKFIKQSPNVDLGKLTDLATLHWEVVHDKIGVQEASQEISRLMRDPPEYKNWQTVLIGAMCSAFIGPAAFNSSFLDVLVSAPLGAGLVAAQLFVANKSDVLSQIFEIVVTGFSSFVAAGLASSGYFCYSAIIASSVVLILPGWLVCCAALELQSRSIVSGSVRLIWAVIYALFLGIGISVGAEFWTLLSGKPVLVGVDGTCRISHSYDKWYRRTIPIWSAFLVVPGYALFLAMRQQARLNSKEIWVMVILASGGFTANHFASIAFPNRSDISSALGSFVVGFLANIYGRLFQGTSFIVALVPILFQLPSGLGNGGLLYFANTSDSSHSFIDGFQVGEQLLEVSLGLVLGLFVATVLVYPFGNRRGGLMAF